MGFWSRFRAIFGAKVNRALDQLENPAETLDYSYEKQVRLLTDVRRGLAEIATAKQRLKLQLDKLQQQEAKYDSQARAALQQGREDLARLALQRKTELAPQITSLQQQVENLDAQQAKLQDASQKLQTRIEMFRTQKEALKAQYSASKAQVRINESFTGISREMNDMGTALQRAQERIETAQARAAAIDELVDTGALEDYTAQLGVGDDIDQQLRLSTGASEVDLQLEALKAQLATEKQGQLEDKGP